MIYRLVGVVVLTLGLVSAAVADTGVVVLEDTPSCDHFIIETSGGYTLAEWYGGAVSVWEGDRVYGDLNSYGFKTIFIDGRGEMRVWIDDFWASRTKALEFYYQECG